MTHTRTLRVFTTTGKGGDKLAHVLAGMLAGVLGGLLASAPAHAATANANASATVIAPLAIAAASDLAFGSFAPGAGGSVTISTSGARSASGVLLLTSSASAARFNITGQPNATYTITHGGTPVLTNAASDTMALAKFSDLTAGNATSGNVAAGTLGAAGTQSLYVGGTLTVAAAQPAGVYTGDVIATVEYN